MSRRVETASPTDGQTCERFLEAVSTFARVHAVKIYCAFQLGERERQGVDLSRAPAPDPVHTATTRASR